jgi:hypothetical protein
MPTFDAIAHDSRTCGSRDAARTSRIIVIAT